MEWLKAIKSMKKKFKVWGPTNAGNIVGLQLWFIKIMLHTPHLKFNEPWFHLQIEVFVFIW